MRSIIILTLSSFLLNGCYDQIVTTHSEPLKVEVVTLNDSNRFDNYNSFKEFESKVCDIPADGMSFLKVIIGSEKHFSPDQIIKIGATHRATLHRTPPVDTITNTGPITFNPKSKLTILYLKASREVSNEVQIWTEVNSLISTKTVRFTRSYPEEINFSKKKFNIKVDETKEVDLRKFKNLGAISNGCKIQLEASNEELIEYEYEKNSNLLDMPIRITGIEPGTTILKAFVVDKPEINDSIKITIE